MLPSQPVAIMPTDSPYVSGLPPSSASSASLPSSASSASLAEQLGLAGLVILPMPDTDIVATLRRLAREHSDQLDSSSTQDTLIFYGATAAHIEALDRADEGADGCRPWRITFFGEEKAGLLFLRMPEPVHHVAHSHLFLRLWEWVIRMGLRKNAYAVGASTYKGIIGTQIKEGDSGFRPDPPRDCGNHFPTLVIEAGNSESLPRLHMDKDWWFDNSPPGGPRGDVKVVLTIKIYRRTKRILLELWHRGCRTPSQTITVTPHQYADEPLSLDAQDLQANWLVTGAPLIIPFEHVFLRPRRGHLETDFILSVVDLAACAFGCWKAGIVV